MLILINMVVLGVIINVEYVIRSSEYLVIFQFSHYELRYGYVDLAFGK